MRIILSIEPFINRSFSFFYLYTFKEDKIKDEVWDILQKMKSPIEKEDIIVDVIYQIQYHVQ